MGRGKWRYDRLILREPIAKGTSPLFEAGSRVAGRYRVEALLGQGSVSAVYRVHDERNGKPLALKQLRVPTGANEAGMVARFELEYHTLMQLTHPRIVAVHDYGMDGGQVFYTMDLLDGSDVHVLGAQPWQRACRLLFDVASALALLHSRGLVYRDISPRNVRCNQEGRATLFDFGALAPMAQHKQVIGTPPFVPPEAVEMQSLDGRADLYGLGVLAYWLLTSVHPYPARTLRGMRAAWRIPPLPPRKHVPGLPHALNDLVMELVQLERDARPSTAAEVMERLSGIAGLCSEEGAAVSRAYLVTPALIGRDEVLEPVRVAIARAARKGPGACFVIEGAHGTGRSRFLDSCLLDARLQNALVLRADAAEGADRPYGLARALCSQLWAEAQDLCRANLPADSSALAVVLPELAGGTLGHEAIERSQQQLAVRDFVAACARERPLVIAVDDLAGADGPSAGWLATLSHAASEFPLVLLVTRIRGPALDTAEGAIRALSQVLEMKPLDAGQTFKLLRSIFGDVEHLHSLAEEAQRMSQGNLRLTLALCEWLVDHGMARYQAGIWRLPAALSAELSPSMSDALWTRIAALPPAARELAEALAQTEPLALAMEDLPTLRADRDRGETLRALDALLSAGVLVGAGERFRFAHEQLQKLLVARIEPARAQVLHARVVEALERSKHPVLLPLELAQSGRALEAIALVLERRDQDDRHPRRIELLERLVLASERLQQPTHTKLQLRLRLVSAAADLGDVAHFEPHASWLADRLERDSGLADHRELPATEGEELRRIHALERAEQRYAAAHPRERGLSPQESLDSLLALCLAHISISGAVQDIELVERLPSLRAWGAFSASVDVVQQAVTSQIAMLAGRYDDAMQTSRAILLRVEQPDRAGLPPALAERVWLLQHSLHGLMTAVVGDARAERWIAGLECQRGYRALGARLRMVYLLMHVKLDAAAQCQRKAELFEVLDGGSALFPEMTVRVELLVHLYASDILGVKHGLERVAQLASQYPKWQPTLWIVRSYYRRLQGDLEGCCAALETALSQLEPGRHFDWGFAVSSYVGVLVALGRGEEALERGRAFLETARRERLTRAYGSLLGPTVVALLSLDRAEEALRVSQEQVAFYEQIQAGGLLLAMAYELRARVAFTLGDLTTARRYADRCAHESAPDASPTVSPLYRRLQAHAEALGYTLDP